MKKAISVVKIILPAAVLAILTFTLQGGKDILSGIYVIFPLIYVFQGIFLSKSNLGLALGILLSDAAFLVSVNLWYHMGNCIDLAVIYTVLGLIAYIIKIIVKKSLLKKKNREH